MAYDSSFEEKQNEIQPEFSEMSLPRQRQQNGLKQESIKRKSDVKKYKTRIMPVALEVALYNLI